MITKFLITIGLVTLAWVVFTRLSGARGATSLKSRRADPLRMQETVRCPACGIYLPRGEPCSCADRA